MKIIAIITARSGSKTIRHKNIRNLGGIPLLGWVVKATSKSTLIHKTILSTDSEEYFRIGREFNKDLIFHKRIPQLAEDVPSELVLLDVLETSKELFDTDSLVVLIQPTTPFITHQDIDTCIEKLIKKPEMNSCISVKEVTEYPEWMITKKAGYEDIGMGKTLSGNVSIRQNLEKRWMPNGGAYVVRKSFLEKNKKIVDEDETIVHEMTKIRSIDIDEEDDFIICEALVSSDFIHQEM